MDYSLLVSRCRASQKQPDTTGFGFHSLHCLPSTNSEECFYFGFIDLTQGKRLLVVNHSVIFQACAAAFTKVKQMERFAKVYILCQSKYAVSSAPPGYYARRSCFGHHVVRGAVPESCDLCRFIERMNEYILPELSIDHEIMQAIIQTDWAQFDS